jgi:hypothetical protein
VTYTERLSGMIYWGILLFAVLMIADRTIGLGGYDSTDAGTERSGMKPLTDAATGCEYLHVAFGGITPRIGPAGKQMGCRS